MPILDIQKRARELGRIRIGQTQPTKNGGTRPAKLDRFRITSQSRPLVEKVSELYGGTVAEWTPANGGPSGWEVVTDADRLPVLVPPQAVSQYYELWSGGGCQRRCDGVRELLGESPCICGPDPHARECKPTTRLNVVLRDVEGVGNFRLETHGYYAAAELPAVADLLAQTSGYISAWLALEERTAVRDGQTRRWMVPTLEVDITPAELMSGQGGTGAAPVSGQQPTPEVAPGEAPAIEAAASGRDWHAEVERAGSADRVRELYREAVAAGAMTADLQALMREQADVYAQTERTGTYTPSTDRPPELGEQPAADPAPADGQAPAGELADGRDVDDLWMGIVNAWPGTMTALNEAYAARNGGELAGNATAAQLREFLGAIKAGRITPDGPADPSTGTGEGVPF